ncbi:MAG: M81 family metallopeptidase [Bacteroidales bacterium]|nr:M81 family metallopeptidase [Bacteroidales bacterium]
MKARSVNRFIPVIYGFVTAVTLAFSACSGENTSVSPAGQQVILYAEFMHEVNSFSPVITTEVNFRAENADIIVGYHTNSHRDHFKTAFKAGDLLIRTVQDEIDPVMVVNKMKLLKGGGINVDFLPPFRKIFASMKKMEKQPDVRSVSFFPEYRSVCSEICEHPQANLPA